MLRLQQTIASAPAHDADPTFSLAVWVGTVGGSALGTDPNPNTTPPSGGRILRCLPRRGLLLQHGAAQVRLVCGVVAASSITLQPWFFDATQNLWVQYGAPVTITPTGAAANQIGVTIGMVGGAQIFVQITANTLVQALGYDYA
jgi:hypothetical protein